MYTVSIYNSFIIRFRKLHRSITSHGVSSPYIFAHLIREIVGVEHQLHVARLANERLRLLRLTAKHPRLPPVRHVRLRITIHNLQIAAIALRRIHQRAHLELLEAQPEHPVAWGAAERAEAIGAGHRAAAIVVGHLGRGDVLVHVDRFVAVVLDCVAARRAAAYGGRGSLQNNTCKYVNAMWVKGIKTRSTRFEYNAINDRGRIVQFPYNAARARSA